MIAFLLFALFFVLLVTRILGIDTSLAPGLSVKNVFLYACLVIVVVRATVAFPEARMSYVPLNLVFLAFIFYCGSVQSSEQLHLPLALVLVDIRFVGAALDQQ